MNYLYLLVRNDMVSLGAGKSIAQGAHAANQFMFEHIIETPKKSAVEWAKEAKGFGTTIALSASIHQIDSVIESLALIGNGDIFFDKTVDPEYPLMDGKTFHSIPNVVTGAYVFGDKEMLKTVLGNLPLVNNDPIPTQ